MSQPHIFHRPANRAEQLFLLHHGVGGTARDLAGVGARLAIEFPQALIVGVEAPFQSELGRGAQWFSVQGITEENRLARVAAAMPDFVADTQRWQQESGVPPEATALIGFSQGAIMALESTQLAEFLAGRVVALSGRFAKLPEKLPPKTTIHLIHGKTDSVIHYQNCIAGAETLVHIGADVTADVLPFLGHEINAEVIDLMMTRLKGYVPKRHWDEALRQS